MSLTVYNLNKKNENGEYIWSDKDVYKHNQKMKKENNTKQVIWKCGYYTEEQKCIKRVISKHKQ